MLNCGAKNHQLKKNYIENLKKMGTGSGEGEGDNQLLVEVMTALIGCQWKNDQRSNSQLYDLSPL